LPFREKKADEQEAEKAFADKKSKEISAKLFYRTLDY